MTKPISQIALLAAMAISAGTFVTAAPGDAAADPSTTQTRGFNPSDAGPTTNRVGNRILNFTSDPDDLPTRTIGGGRGDGGNGAGGDGGGGGGGGGGNDGGGEGGSPQ